MAREIAAVQKLTDTEALKLLDEQLQKSPRRTAKNEDAESDQDSDTDTGDADSGDVEEAA